jgi:hypothetical protein
VKGEISSKEERKEKKQKRDSTERKRCKETQIFAPSFSVFHDITLCSSCLSFVSFSVLPPSFHIIIASIIFSPLPSDDQSTDLDSKFSLSRSPLSFLDASFRQSQKKWGVGLGSVICIPPAEN